MSRTYKPWTPDDDAALVSLLEQGCTFPQIAEQMERSTASVKERAHGRGMTRRNTRVIAQRHSATVLAPISTSPEPDDSFLSRVLDATDQSVMEHQQEKYATLRIEADQPIGLSLSSDWHLTTKGPANVRGLIEHAEAIRDTEHAYALAVGDLTDNPIKHKPTATNDVPDDLRLLDIVVGKFGGKLLGTTSGNHDDWTRAFVGIDSLQSMAERHQLHYAPDELIWSVEIVAPGTDTVTARWTIATRHKFRRHSNLNHTHACWRWAEENEYNWPTDEEGRTMLPDVYAIGHNHVAAVEHRTYEGRTVIGVRMGAWQYTSPFTRAGGWALMPPTAPVLILPPSREEPPHAFEHWQAGLEALRRFT